LIVLVDLEVAQSAFESLPTDVQVPTLSPVYCAADASRDQLLRPRFLLLASDDCVLLYSVHESRVPGGGADWQSPYGYGGPIGFGMTESTLREAWSAFDGIARERGVIAEFVRFHPLVDNHRLYPGTVTEDRRIVRINLRQPDLAASYSVRGRNTLRKAQRAGLVASWEDPGRSGEQFAALYTDAMRRIGASDFYHFGPEYFGALFALPYARVLAVRQAGMLVAAAVVLCGPQVMEYHLSGTTPEGRALGATNLLIHEAALCGKMEGCSWFYLGGGTDSSADNPLLRFKESFAPASGAFRIGSRVLDAERYEQLRRCYPEQARRSGRVLFYRGA
jgi:hypothetical protein